MKKLSSDNENRASETDLREKESNEAAYYHFGFLDFDTGRGNQTGLNRQRWYSRRLRCLAVVGQSTRGSNYTGKEINKSAQEYS